MRNAPQKHPGRRVQRKPRRANKVRISLRFKFAVVLVPALAVPIAILAMLALNRISSVSYEIREIAMADTTTAFEDSAEEALGALSAANIMYLETFFRQRDHDILLLANFMPSDEAFRLFSESRTRDLITQQRVVPIYDEITFIDLYGQELFKFVHPDSTKVEFPLNPQLVDVSIRANTYVGEESYWEAIGNLRQGEVFVSESIGRHVPDADWQFEGIIRRVTPVVDFEGEIWGFVTMALNYIHVLDIFDTPVPQFDYPTILAELEDRLDSTIDSAIEESTAMLIAISAGALLFIIIVVVIVSSSVTKPTPPEFRRL